MVFRACLPILVLLLCSCTKTGGTSAAPNSPGLAKAQRPDTPESIKIWKTITQVDPTKGLVPPEAKALVGKDVAVVGFMIPNDAGGINEVQEFLLTPVAGGCIHVPPPPPNYIVHVTMEHGQKTKVSFGAVEVRGKLLRPPAGQDGKMYTFELFAYNVNDFDADAYMKY